MALIQEQPPFADDPQHVVGSEDFFIVKEDVLDGLLANAGDFSEAQALSSNRDSCVAEALAFLSRQSFPECAFGQFDAGHVEPH